MRSAQKYGITHEQIAEWAAEVKSTVEYSPELINHLNVKIAQVLAGDVVTVESQDLPEGEDEETWGSRDCRKACSGGAGTSREKRKSRAD
jgi:hypothetical protein